MVTISEFIYYITSGDGYSNVEGVDRFSEYLPDELYPVHEFYIGGVRSGKSYSVEYLCSKFEVSKVEEVEAKVFSRFLRDLKILQLKKQLLTCTERSQEVEIMEKLVLLSVSDKEDDIIPRVDSCDIDLSESALQEGIGIRYPATLLNEDIGSALPGWSVIIAGGTGMGKTTFANSIVVTNSVFSDKTVVYFYSEGLVREYLSGIWSAFSQTNPEIKTESSYIKRVTDSDEDGKALLRRMHKEYKDHIKGRIVFVYAGDLDSDPIVLESQVRKILKEEGADYFVVDTLTRMGSSPSTGYKDVNVYMRHITTVFTNLCVTEQVVGFLLCQLTVGGEQGAKKLNVSSADILGKDMTKDASQTIIVMSSPETVESGRCHISCTKNRHGKTPVEPLPVSADYSYSWIGDVIGTGSITVDWDGEFTDEYYPFNDQGYSGEDLSF